MNTKEIIKGIESGTDKYYGTGHFHISNMSDYTLMSTTISDMSAVYGINEVEASEIIQVLTHS